ncbi:hypothetical protein Agub_g12740 [Astrephomene gubernaculifera]|uniref:Uncharacterized protein n=1 Tax=Astrephomene gubernaculifera TaxID=47775 RepID=A0AAD3HS05_9CHLO|nr:hypothetical protein Agub_g12740 [Astrephomene gubernaculifera]
MNRKESLLEVFSLFDDNGNGYVEQRELRALSNNPTAEGRMDEALETLALLDVNGDRRVSAQEFVQVFEFIGAQMGDPEFDALVGDMRQQAGASLSREEMLRRVFQKLDRDKSGYIEMHELRTLVGRVAPAESLHRAHGTLRMFDTNSDDRVSCEEFLAVFGFLAQQMDDREFKAFVSRLARKGFEALYEEDYRHPHGCRSWLLSEVVPVLRGGLLALVREVERDALDLATGIPWDEGVHMPRGWRPFSPMRWLAGWLEAAATAPPRRGSEGGAGGGEGEGEGAGGEGSAKRLEAMSREEKLAYIFSQIDTNASGSIPAHNLVSIAELIFAEGAGGVTDPRDVIDPVLAALGIHPLDSVVDAVEFEQALTQMTSLLSDAEFDEAARVVAAQRDWRYCRSRADKFRYLFHSLDLDHSGALTFNELKAMAQRMDPDVTEETVSASLDYMDRDHSDTVSAEEFVTALSSLLGHVDSEAALDDMVQRMMHLRGGADPANEVEPPALAEFVRGLRTHGVAAQLSTSIVLDKLSSRQPLVLLDVRPDEERAVSVMPGALPLALQPAPAATWGYSLAGGPAPAVAKVREALAAVTAAAQPTAQPPVVAAYCSTGELGGVAALLLSDALRITVYNICGGIINYYNQGGSVCRPGGAGEGGKPVQVQALHPGSQQQRAFVTRPNNYR